MKIYHSLYAVNMVCELPTRRQSGFCVPVSPPFQGETHNDSPANVKTYDFIRMVSFRGHSQYLATWAKMTPWQMDCKMPSIRMGALMGTSVCAASDSEDIMGVRGCGGTRPLQLQRLINAPFLVLVGTIGFGRPASQRRNTTRPRRLGTTSRFQVNSQSCLTCTRTRRRTARRMCPWGTS